MVYTRHSLKDGISKGRFIQMNFTNHLLIETCLKSKKRKNFNILCDTFMIKLKMLHRIKCK